MKAAEFVSRHLSGAIVNPKVEELAEAAGVLEAPAAELPREGKPIRFVSYSMGAAFPVDPTWDEVTEQLGKLRASVLAKVDADLDAALSARREDEQSAEVKA